MSFEAQKYLSVDRLERINKDMQLILYSPGICVLLSEGRYITDIRMQPRYLENWSGLNWTLYFTVRALFIKISILQFYHARRLAYAVGSFIQ